MEIRLPPLVRVEWDYRFITSNDHEGTMTITCVYRKECTIATTLTSKSGSKAVKKATLKKPKGANPMWQCACQYWLKRLEKHFSTEWRFANCSVNERLLYEQCLVDRKCPPPSPFRHRQSPYPTSQPETAGQTKPIQIGDKVHFKPIRWTRMNHSSSATVCLTLAATAGLTANIDDSSSCNELVCHLP